MLDTPENVRQQIMILIPLSILDEIACFTFYDNHPMDNKNIDITVCTKNGELKEFYQRDLISSLSLNCVTKPSNIKILRSNSLGLFYLVSTEDELVIVSRKENLKIYKRLTNISTYEILDFNCIGEYGLKVTRKDDAMPLYFNNNFESVEYQGSTTNTVDHDTLPILTELKRKLVEARYTSKCNKDVHSQYLYLRQKISLLSFQNLQGSFEYKNESHRIPGTLTIRTQKPRLKICNQNIILILNVVNESSEFLESIHFLLQNNSSLSFIYTTKLFTKLKNSFWWETTYKKLKPNEEVMVVAVMYFEELKLSVTSRIDLSGSISYKKSGKECLLPFEDVQISSLESMGDEFDVLSESAQSDDYTILAVLASTEKTELCLRRIKINDEPEISMLDLFCTYLQMEPIRSNPNVIVYRKSPYHVLNGTMIVFHESDIKNRKVTVSVHTRLPSQVLALIHLIHDAIPAKIIATTPTYKITSKSEYQYNEEMSPSKETVNYMNYAASVLNRSAKVLNHLDNSMIAMSESKVPSVQSKVGSHIDLFAGGVENFKVFRKNILEEGKRGVDSLVKSDVDSIIEIDTMVME